VLELTPRQRVTSLQRHATLVNWAEAAVGSPQEWIDELQYVVNNRITEVLDIETRGDRIIEVISTFSPGQYISTDGNLPWEMSTPQPF
jgi:hypothetical protein